MCEYTHLLTLSVWKGGTSGGLAGKMAKRVCLGIKTGLALWRGLQLAGSVTLDLIVPLCASAFSSVEEGNLTRFRLLLWGLDERILVICLAQCLTHCKCVALLSFSSSYHYHHREGDHDGRLRRYPGWRGDKEDLSLVGTGPGKSGTQAFFVSLFHPYTYSLSTSLSLSPGLPPRRGGGGRGREAGSFLSLDFLHFLVNYIRPTQHPFPPQGIFISSPFDWQGWGVLVACLQQWLRMGIESFEGVSFFFRGKVATDILKEETIKDPWLFSCIWMSTESFVCSPQ